MSPDHLLQRVERAIDACIAAADQHDGLIPSMMDRETGAMLVESPPHIEGQRDGDRAHCGSNLMHDESLLRTMRGLADARGRTEYADAADRYLNTFVTRCADTPSGLFPWGEHAYWHLTEQRIASSYVYGAPEGKAPYNGAVIHDHLRSAPRWLWDAIRSINPSRVERFAEGLDNHWVRAEGFPTEYIRHAPVERMGSVGRGGRSCDFPRHGGFYIFDWAYAWVMTGRDDFRKQIDAMLDYWWEMRDDAGLCLIESRCPEDDKTEFHETNAPPQTLSLASSMLEAAELVEAKDADLAALMRQRAGVYIDGFLAAPHDMEAGVFVILCKRADGRIVKTMPIWGSVYGVWPASYAALNCLCVHRMTGDTRLLDWAAVVGERYATEDFPHTVVAPAMDAGMGLGLLADLYDITGDSRWIDAAMTLSDRLVAVCFDDKPLPRSAIGIDWYDSQSGPGFLLHGLARAALLAADGRGVPLGPDYTGR